MRQSSVSRRHRLNASSDAAPNILLICTDQQRYDTIARVGLRDIQTPNMDRLADDGVLFEQAYTASPVCAPSRASIMTGEYPSSHGLWANGVTLPTQAVFTKILADNGYTAGLIGKLHLSAAWKGRTEQRIDDGFRYYRWAHDPSHPSVDNDYHRWLREEHPGLYGQAMAHGRGAGSDPEATGFDLLPPEAHYSRWVSTRTTEFLTGRADGDDPFFLWVNFFDPHHPFVVPAKYLDRYQDVSIPLGIDTDLDIPLPAALEAMRTYANAAGARAFSDYSRAELVDVVRAYYAMTTMVDDEIGRILRCLDANGLYEDTLVVLTSDHGEMLTDHGLLLKGPALYEGAVRVPLIMRWPGVRPRGERRSSVVQLVDLPATILDAAGCSGSSWHQGESLLTAATEGDERWSREWALCQYRDSGRPDSPPTHATMLRWRNWKLVVFHGEPVTARGREYQLFDLSADPEERSNLADDSGHAPKLFEMVSRLLDIEVALEDRSAERVAPW